MPLSFFNGSSSYGSAVPFQRTSDSQQLGFFLNLEQPELLRIKRYNESWRFYHGNHWNFTREDGEPLVTLNYLRKFVDKHAEFLCGKGFVTETVDALEEVIKPYLEEVWTYNKKMKLCLDSAVTGGVTGDVFYLVTDEEPSDMQRRVFPHSEGMTRINLLGSEQVYPTWDPLNHETLVSVRIETVYHDASRVHHLDDSQQSVGGGGDGRQPQTKRFTQIITAAQIIEQFHGEPPTVKPNLLGEIPLVHISNLSVPKEYYGMSDIEGLIDLQRELNEKSTDISDIVHYHAAPITVITGAKVKQLERSPRKIWSGLPEGATVSNLELSGDLNVAHTWWDKIKRTMHELGDIPEGILGQMQPISNTSGVALHQQYGPIVGRAQRKRVNYADGFQRINYFILRIGQLKGRISLPFDVCKSCGGRILHLSTGETTPVWDNNVQNYVDVPRTKKVCFHINKQTLDFMRPELMKLKVWREYGFGGQEVELTLESIKREISSDKESYWDYAYENKVALRKWEEECAAIEKENAAVREETGKAGLSSENEKAEGTEEIGAQQQQSPALKSLPPKPKPKIAKLPSGEVNVPLEPVEVELLQPLLHPNTGEVVRTIRDVRLLVPTGCENPRFANPFETKVVFNDVLPKDEAMLSALYLGYQAAKWVDREWVQQRIPEIAGDAKEINRRLKEESSDGTDTGEDTRSRVTDLTPAENERSA